MNVLITHPEIYIHSLTLNIYIQILLKSQKFCAQRNSRDGGQSPNCMPDSAYPLTHTNLSIYLSISNILSVYMGTFFVPSTRPIWQ